MKAKEFIPQSKPRNFVAKNQKTAGAGAHKDLKRSEKQGDVKHKKDRIPMEGLSEISDETKSSYKEKAKSQVKELEPWTKKGEYKDLAKRAIQRREKGLSRFKEKEVEEGIKSKIAGAALAAANLLGSPAQSAEEPVKPITIAYVMIDGEVRKYNLGDRFDNAKEAEKFISGVLDKQGLQGYTLDIKHGYPKKKELDSK
jgi:hypothetical protein